MSKRLRQCHKGTSYKLCHMRAERGASVARWPTQAPVDAGPGPLAISNM